MARARCPTPLGWTLVGLRASIAALGYRERPVRAWARLTVDQWRAIDAETPRDPARGTFDCRVLVVLVVVAVSLTLQEYIGDRGMLRGALVPVSTARPVLSS